MLVGVDGERVLVEGTVAGERLVQDFPDGLAGVPRRLTTLPDGAFFAAPVIQRDRILFVVLDAGMSARGPWRLFLAEGGAAPRIVLSGDSHTERPPLYPVLEEGPADWGSRRRARPPSRRRWSCANWTWRLQGPTRSTCGSSVSATGR